MQRLVELGKHVTDGVECVITGRRHPLRFLEKQQKDSS
jgi:hypothetical protein